VIRLFPVLNVLSFDDTSARNAIATVGLTRLTRENAGFKEVSRDPPGAMP
jgi:hypothetical protein